MSFTVGLIGLHILVAALVAFIFYLRVRNRPLFRLPSFARKGA
jgi:lipopolysaccharide export system permease protein